MCGRGIADMEEDDALGLLLGLAVLATAIILFIGAVPTTVVLLGVLTILF